MNNIEEIKRKVTSRLDPSRQTKEEEIWQITDEVLKDAEYRLIGLKEKLEIRKKIFNEIKRLDILQELLEDPEITEIMVNGYSTIFYEKNGVMTKWDKCFSETERLTDIVQRIAASSNKIINEAVPIADTRLADGSRVNVVMSPIAINGPVITIRKFYETPLSIEKMTENDSITQEAADFLKKLVRAKYNIFVSGGTGSGKTTFLNALSNFIPKTERIVTIEDSAELRLYGTENIVRLEARNANLEGKNAITIRDLLKSSLRMRPDRIIVGEVRGPEAIDMLQALNTGHSGFSTGHANGPEEMTQRLETMVLMGMDMPVFAIRNQIASAIDIIVHLGRLRDASRRVLSISEVCGVKNGEVCLKRLFQFEEEGTDEKGKIIGSLKRTKAELENTDKLRIAGD